MKISLINPNLSGDVSILDMGLIYLATYINQRTTHQASLIDFTFHRKNWREYMDEQIEKKATGFDRYYLYFFIYALCQRNE